MDDVWSGFRESFARSIRPLSAQRAFIHIRSRRPTLQRFVDPCSAVAFLNDRDGDRDEKDALCRDLILEVQGGGCGASLARSVLFLAFWPRLQKTYGTLRRHYGGRLDELASDITDQFLGQIQRADFARIHRVAATLTLNVDRDLRRDLKRSWQRESLEDELPQEDSGALVPHLLVHRPAHACSSVDESVLDVPLSLSFEDQVVVLRERLAMRLGREDADLVVDVLVLAKSQCDLAKDSGIKPATSRKRIERARARLRTSIKESQAEESHSAAHGGVSVSGRPCAPWEAAHEHWRN